MTQQVSRQQESKTDLRLNTPLLPASAGIFGILYALTGYRGWLVFLLGAAGVWLLALWWMLALRRGLRIERKVHLAWATVGDSVPEQLEVTNRSRFPAVWVEILDDSGTLAQPLRLVTDVDRGSTRRRHPVHSFTRRGLYTLGPTCLRTGDPFGTYDLTVHHEHASTILITPPLLSLAQLQIPSGGWAGERKNRRMALTRDTSDVSIRPYAAGDSFKRIHWRASAHQDTLVVRQLEAAAADDWWIFVDLDARAQAGTGQDSTLELSIVLAASLAIRGLREHRRVGLALIGPDLVWLEPRSDLAHRWKLLRELSIAEAGKRSLAELLSAGRPSRTASLIVITSSADAAWVANAGTYQRRGSVSALLVDPMDFGGKLGQEGVTTCLARSRIPYVRMPGSLLAEAYGRPAANRNRGAARTVQSAQRFLAHSRSIWRSID